MSYCRVGDDSDVYVYPREGEIVCCGCPMIGEDLVVQGAMNMLTHLQGHIERGEKVPHAAMARLLKESGFYDE